MDRIYKLTITDFDVLENNFFRALCKRELFFKNNNLEKDVIYKILNHPYITKKYKGWDGEYYPLFEIEEIKIL